MSVHKGITTCRVCGKVQSRVANLKRHLARVHQVDMDLNPINQETPFDGNFSPIQFVYQCLLKYMCFIIHKIIPFLINKKKIDFPGQGQFWNLSEYQGDDGIFEGEGFPCTMCPKTFKFRSSLSHHMKTHTGEATCPKCGKVLSSKANMNRHMRNC